MNQIIRSLMDRKSVRSFTSQEIPEDIVQEILEASTQAPTAGNQQLYTILRISDAEKKRRLSYSAWMKAFCDRKYNSDFSREMTRSVREYLKDFSGKDNKRRRP